MTDESNANVAKDQMLAASMGSGAVLVDRFAGLKSGEIVRISFFEHEPRADMVHLRAAVVMSLSAVRELHGMLDQILNEADALEDADAAE